ncbi:hypothetical protein PIB19_00950 [Sphingomonas sp. 7/4-4]|nr:hypothetical protein [Sphingomonas sp. 7/4-4]WBY08156.1 hypothetical protein PIB19_00950 [Sphingomonas sp. 7/4-4]
MPRVPGGHQRARRVSVTDTETLHGGTNMLVDGTVGDADPLRDVLRGSCRNQSHAAALRFGELGDSGGLRFVLRHARKVHPGWSCSNAL